MKTLFTDYLVILQPNSNGDWWGAVSITNHAHIQQSCEIHVFDFLTGRLLKTANIQLPPKGSVLLDRTHTIFEGITGRVRLYIDCPDTVTASAGMSRGTVAGLNMIPIQELPFPKS